MTGPLVSIIIPALNAACWIRAALASCCSQSWRHIEIIVVDTGSSDGTADIANAFDRSIVRVSRCFVRNASAARNVGMGLSRGSYIQYLDADDLLAPTKIESQLTRLREAGNNSVAIGPWARFKSDISGIKVVPQPIWQDLEPHDFLTRSWIGEGMMPSFGWLIPRAIVERAGPWDESLTLNDDGEFFSRAVLQSKRILFCPDAMGYYRTTSLPSLSKDRSREALASGLKSIELCTGHLLARRDDLRVRESCACNFQRFAYEAYPAHPDLAEFAEHKVSELGGCNLRCAGGALFQMLSAIVGWRAAKRLRALAHSLKARFIKDEPLRGHIVCD